MKTIVSSLACLTIALLAVPAIVRAETSAVRVRTEQVNKTDEKAFAKSQSRSLKVYVSNASKEMMDLKVKYFFFGRDVKTHEFVTVDQGEKPIQVKPLATEMVETSTAKTNFVENHLEGKGASAKKVEASGSKFVGHAVQVLQADKVVAESCEPASMKEQIGKAGAAPKPEAVKK